jgi:hypothetical protein
VRLLCLEPIAPLCHQVVNVPARALAEVVVTSSCPQTRTRLKILAQLKTMMRWTHPVVAEVESLCLCPVYGHPLLTAKVYLARSACRLSSAPPAPSMIVSHYILWAFFELVFRKRGRRFEA